MLTCTQESKEEDDDLLFDDAAIYLRRLDGGLFTLQTVDYILAWIVMEDDGVGLGTVHFASCTNLLSDPSSRVTNAQSQESVAIQHR